MLHENGMTIGIGLALVDVKFRQKDSGKNMLTTDECYLSNYLDSIDGYVQTAGGATCNVVCTYADFLESNFVRLFATVGSDEKGKFYQRESSYRVGPLQIDSNNSTGITAFILNGEGEQIDSISYLGVSKNITIPFDELVGSKIALLISHARMFGLPGITGQMDRLLQQLHRDSGVFALSLAGTSPHKTPKEILNSYTNVGYSSPDLVFGNEQEAKYLSGEQSCEASINHIYPNARIVVVTSGRDGAIVRFNDRILEIPSFLNSLSIDTTGAGDCFMGIMLSCLSLVPKKNWDYKHVYKSALIGSFAASKVIGNLQSRLGFTELNRVRKFCDEIL